MNQRFYIACDIGEKTPLNGYFINYYIKELYKGERKPKNTNDGKIFKTLREALMYTHRLAKENKLLHPQDIISVYRSSSVL
jgi:hypothetical protein